MNITALITRNARINPDAIALLRPDGKPLPWKTFDAVIDGFARRAHEVGLRPRDKVSLRIADPYLASIAALALARAGIIGAPESMPVDQLDACLIDPDAQPVAGTSNWAVDGRWWTDAPAPADTRSADTQASDSCRIFASTLVPGQFVALSHETLLHRIAMDDLGIPGDETERHLFFADSWSETGFTSFMRTITFGGMAVFATNVEQAISCIEKHRVGKLVAAPRLLKLLVEAMPARSNAIPSLQRVEVDLGLPPPVLDAVVQKLCRDVAVVYRTTETGGIAASLHGQGRAQPGSAGYIYPDAEVQIVDARDNVLPPDRTGSLRVKSAACVDRHYQDAATSAQMFRGGWVYPGDVGALSADGRLVLMHRESKSRPSAEMH